MAESNAQMETTNRPDEWKIEQGLSGASLPVLDMTGPETLRIPPQVRTLNWSMRSDAFPSFEKK